MSGQEGADLDHETQITWAKSYARGSGVASHVGAVTLVCHGELLCWLKMNLVT